MIKLSNVSFSYGEEDSADNNGLKNISLSISKGQVVLLCGQSGCGKTTITRLINGLIPHFYEGNLTGKIIVNGKEVMEQELYDTAKIVGTVFQNPRSQFFNVDTRSELAFGLENRGEAVEYILDKVENTVFEYQMEHLIDRSIFELSGGEKQKIACGCVSSCSPDVFVLDEPSANLDIWSIKQLKLLIAKWKKQGKTIIIAEHRLFYIWDLIDRAVYLKNGVIEKDMMPQEFRSLSETQLHEMGLRSNIECEQFQSRKYLINEMKKITFHNFIFGYIKGKNIINIPKLMVSQNSITAIIGNNGLGKTTFLRCICGLEKKCKGVMECKNKVYKRKQRLKEIFLVMQDVNHQLFTESVMDEVMISMKEENEDKAIEILSALDLIPYKDRHPVSLSGGQKQRVAVATAIASERDILLFDEPTSGLDFYHMLQIADMFKKLKAMGKTLIVVTHDWEFIKAIDANVIKLAEQTE